MKTDNRMQEESVLIGNPVRDWRAILFGALVLLVLLVGNSVRLYLSVVAREMVAPSDQGFVAMIDLARKDRFEQYQEKRREAFETIIGATR